MTVVLLTVLAAAAGVLLGWLLARSRGAAERERAAAQHRIAQERAGAAESGARERLADAESRLAAVEASWGRRLADERETAERRVAEVREAFTRQVADERTRASAQLEEERAGAAQRLEEERASATQRLEEERASAAQRLEEERASAAQRLEEERATATKRLEELRADTQRLAEQFESLSKKALADNSASFLQQAEERLKRTQSEHAAELAKREQAVQQLVEPLNRTLGEIKHEVTTAEKARLTAHSSLAEQVRAMQESSQLLREETSQLVTALRAPQVRGRWGELHLRRIVEVAGMVEHVDFEEQESVAGDDGLLRPDLVVKLPGAKQIVVDAKVAFSAYLEAMEAKDDATRAKRLEAHARHLRKHIDDLSSKAYWERVEGTPEFVVMFVPAEVFLNAALDKDPTILEHAFSRNVVVATPATLVALLRTVGYTWRQEMLAGQAQQVFVVGKELHKRLGVMGAHLITLGKRLNATVDTFNRLNSSIDRNVVTQVRRFSALQGLEPEFESAPPLEILAVPAQKPDVHAAPEEPAALPGPVDTEERIVEARDTATPIAEARDKATGFKVRDEVADLAVRDEAPDLKAPDLKAPDLEAPDLEAPDLEAPDLEAPDAELAELVASELRRSEQAAASSQGSGSRAGKVAAS